VDLPKPIWRSSLRSRVVILLCICLGYRALRPTISTHSSSSFPAAGCLPVSIYLFIYFFQRSLADNNVIQVTWNQARILDPGTFATVATLPQIPGAVNNPAGGRTYPFSGAAMFLPQVAPYTAPVTLLLCGGSTPAKDAIDNCVSITPEVPGAQWTIERMPSQRVLVCMV
jgi:hypothetical protein